MDFGSEDALQKAIGQEDIFVPYQEFYEAIFHKTNVFDANQIIP